MPSISWRFLILLPEAAEDLFFTKICFMEFHVILISLLGSGGMTNCCSDPTLIFVRWMWCCWSGSWSCTMFIPAFCAGRDNGDIRAWWRVVGEILPDMLDQVFAEPPLWHHQIFLAQLCPSPRAPLCSSALLQTCLEYLPPMLALEVSI